jgi:spermidine synthase
MEVLARFLTPLAAGNLAEAVVASATGSELARQRLHEPITYYHRTGPVGQLFESLNGPRGDRPAAFIGLGTGTLASYARPGQEVHYYDIDVEVERLARNPTYFTFLQDSRRRGVRLDVVLGDARLRLREAPDGHYGLIIVDAFSSDAIPIHLITREALQLYLQKLAPDGVLAVHISNRYLDLEPVLGNAAEELRLAGRIRVDRDEDEPGKSSSDWVVLAREESHLGMLAEHERWKALATRSDLRVWTDDFSNLLGVFNWK